MNWKLWAVVASAVFALAGAARIVATYRVFNQVYDEAFSVCCGMQWWTGHYDCDPKHPPLGRAASTCGLYLRGSRPMGIQDHASEANAILGSGAEYWQHLTIARLGVLPFYLLSCLSVWLWTRWAYGWGAAILAVLLFSSLPAVLGNGAIAMTDIVHTGTLGLTLFCWCRWLEHTTIRRSGLLGVSFGLAAISNFSALPLFAAASVAIAGARRFLRTALPAERVRVGTLAVALVAMGGVVWAGYRFTIAGPVIDANGRYPGVDKLTGDHGVLHDAAYLAFKAPIPALPFFSGLYLLSAHNNESRGTGSWYYYPTAFVEKSPLAFVILLPIGLAFLARGRGVWQVWAAPVAVAAMFAVGTLSNVNSGIRHMLSLYVPLAAITGYGAWRALGAGGWMRSAAIVLVVWHLVSSAAAHPDYYAYFNELALVAPIRLDISDVDYGQDLKRLGDVCQRRGIDSLSVAYHGTADLSLSGVHELRILMPHEQATGWIAISLAKLKSGDRGDVEAYAWLEKVQPVEMVGKSIQLYYIPPRAN